MIFSALNTLHRGLSFFSAALFYLAVFACVLLTSFVALSAIKRYFLGAPFRFTEELVGLLFASFIFLALPYITIHRRNLCVSILADKYPVGLRKFADVCALALTLVFALTFGKSVLGYVLFSYRVNASGEVSGLTLYPWMAIMPLAVSAMGIIVAVQVVRRIREDDPVGQPDDIDLKL